MDAKIYYQKDCNLSLLEGKTIAVIGYGSQGHAHALNAKESGCHVIIGLYEGSRSWKKAEEQGFEVYTAAEAAKKADIIMILINDEKQAALYKKDIEPNLEEGNMLMFALRRDRVIRFAASIRQERVFRVLLPFIRMQQERHLTLLWLMHLRLAVQERAFWRLRSVQRRRQTFSVSRPFFAVVSAH